MPMFPWPLGGPLLDSCDHGSVGHSDVPASPFLGDKLALNPHAWDVMPDLLYKAPLGLLPVLILLVTLIYLDSYKLVSLRFIIGVIVSGSVIALATYHLNGLLLDSLGMEFRSYSRYVGPAVEESTKGLVIVYLFRTNRIGFLVDGAIAGFAVGAGFALVENLFYLYLIPDSSTGVWIVRGLGTAVMHGGVTALFAVIAQTLTERHTKMSWKYYLPGLAMATVLHSIFNHFLISPVLSALGTLIAVPTLLMIVFDKSTRVMHDWLEVDFDADEQVLSQIHDGKFVHSKSGRFLLDLRERFGGFVVADMLCYIRLHTELAIRAKSVLIAREFGEEVSTGQEIKDKFDELRALRRDIGKVGFLAMAPYLHMSRKDLWQVFMLENKQM
jgi:RsiW-degrading membrane proteinase PrsW (M82 family)